MIMTTRKKRNASTTSCPISLLYTHHYSQFTKGTDATLLKFGEKKQRAPHKKSKANAVSSKVLKMIIVTTSEQDRRK